MRISTTFLLLLALAGRAAAQAAEQPPPEPTFTWGAEVDISSRYLWHGLAYSDGVVIWPGVWLSAKGFTVDFSANLDPHYDPRFNEHDLSVGYEQALGRLTLRGAFSRYTYRELSGDPGSTSEVVLGAAYTIGPGDVFTNHSIDVENYPGAYYADVGYVVERELAPRSRLTVDASVAFWSKFAEKYELPSDGALGPAMLNVSFEQRLASALAVRPHVTFTRLLDRTARRELDTPAVSYGIAVVIGY